jgi:calcineurin-like phosphoesterase family protein
MYAVNIGDSGNFWGGRLIRKYADQDTSVHTARRLVEWLLLGSGIPWLVWLFGNHEPMGDAQPLIRQMNKRHGTNCVPMFDWEARFKLVFPNGFEFKINAAHDFPGNSMWNPIHGAVKAAKFGNDVDLLVHGHKHNWAISQWEQPEQGNTPLMIRVRGYKHMDSYAQRIGKYEQDEGQSILVVFNPGAKTRAGKMVPFVDIEEGAEYLTFLRNKAG